MDYAFFFECPQGAVERNAVGVAKGLLQVALGNRFVALKEDFQHLFPDGSPPQGMLFEQLAGRGGLSLLGHR